MANRTGRYNLIQIDSLFMTSTGLSTGSPCRSSVSGLDWLSFDYQGQTLIALDGTPYNQYTTTYKRGLPLQFKFNQMSESVLESLISLISSTISGSTTNLIRITGDTGDFVLNCLPMFPKPIEFSGEFQTDQIKDVTLNYIVNSQTYLVAFNAGVYTISGSSITVTVT